MKILIFSTAYIPWVGGAEIAIKEITDRLPGVRFDLLTVNLSGEELSEEKVGNVMVYRVGSGTLGKFLFPIFGFLKARQLHRKNKYDVAWSMMASQASVAAAFFRMVSKVKLVLTLQEGDEEEHLARYVGGNTFLYTFFIKPWHMLVFRKADRVTAISNYLKERAHKAGVRVPIDIVPNGADIARFEKKYSVDELWTVKTTLGKTENEQWIITTSRLVKKNAVDDLILSLHFLPETVRLLIIGVGEDQAKLMNLVREKHLSHRALFLGYKDHREIPKYLHAAQVFVRPSLSEGQGVSFIEAMAAEIPVVATPVGGIVDFLKDGETGLFAEVRKPKTIAHAVKRFLDDPALVERITKNAREMVEKKYSWNMIAEEMKTSFEHA